MIGSVGWALVLRQAKPSRVEMPTSLLPRAGTIVPIPSIPGPRCCLQLAGQRGEPHASLAPQAPSHPAGGAGGSGPAGRGGGGTLGPRISETCTVPRPTAMACRPGWQVGVSSAGGGEAAGASEATDGGWVRPQSGGTSLSVPRSGLNPVGLRVSGRPSVHSRCCWPGERLPAAEPWGTGAGA